jgi:exodeoxyribonuclease V
MSATAIDLSAEQEAAMAAIDAFVADTRRQLLVIHGQAGVGKSTLLAHVANQYGHAALACLTGKGADVIRSKTGLSTCCTIHHYFYQLKSALTDEHGRKRLEFVPKHFSGDLNGDLVLVDECSMVPVAIGEQLLNTGAKVIAVGDPGQLPPVNAEPFFTVPDITLTEVHRQARDSGIIRQALRVRAGHEYQADGDDVRIVPARSVIDDDVRAADILLCWTNRTRARLSALCRTLFGFTAPHPLADETLLCLKNAPAYGVWNGGIYVLREPYHPGDPAITVIADGRVRRIPRVVFVGLDAEDDTATTNFDYGYALTVHKAQGSEWRSVLLFDEYRLAQNRTEWLYTAITRAAQRLVIAR